MERIYLDIAYANISEKQKLDIYLPDNGDGLSLCYLKFMVVDL